MLKNEQPPEKADHSGYPYGLLDIQSIFKTIQGEGPFAGQPATFIRLAGCNLQCPMCDTDYTSTRAKYTPPAVLSELRRLQVSPNKLIVISGGEPFRQHITGLVEALLRHGYRVQIETNGTLAPDVFPYSAVSIVCSPKAGAVNKRLWPHITAYKYVLRQGQIDHDDGLPERALDHPAAPKVARPHAGYTGPIYVQPCDEQDPERNKINLYECMASAQRHGYTLCLQQHKIIGVD